MTTKQKLNKRELLMSYKAKGFRFILKRGGVKFFRVEPPTEAMVREFEEDVRILYQALIDERELWIKKYFDEDNTDAFKQFIAVVLEERYSVDEQDLLNRESRHRAKN